jgi:hypothetical protein
VLPFSTKLIKILNTVLSRVLNIRLNTVLSTRLSILLNARINTVLSRVLNIRLNTVLKTNSTQGSISSLMHNQTVHFTSHYLVSSLPVTEGRAGSAWDSSEPYFFS